EIAACHTRDLRERAGRLALLVHGKGARERIVPVPEHLGRHLLTLPDGYLFPSDNADGHLSPRYVGKLAAEVLPPSHTLHTLRHVGLDVDELWSVVDAVGRAPLPAPSRLRESA